MLLAFDDEHEFAGRLARAAGRQLGRIGAHRFPDGEWRIVLPPRLPADVAILRSLHSPSDRLVQVLIAAATARELGAGRVTLVAPYLCYMRQDARFTPGEAVSQRIVGGLLADRFDRVVTVDPHLHRIDTLAEAIPAGEAIALSAAPLIGEFIGQRLPDAIFVGPDAESAQWVSAAARARGAEHGVCTKLRRGDREVQVALPDIPVAGRRCVLVDDMASTGNTLAQAARALLAAGCASVDAAVCHVLPGGEAQALARAAGVGDFWSTDTIPDASNAIGVAGLVGAAIGR